MGLRQSKVRLPLAPSLGAAHCRANTHLLTGRVPPEPCGMSLRGQGPHRPPPLQADRKASQGTEVSESPRLSIHVSYRRHLSSSLSWSLRSQSLCPSRGHPHVRLLVWFFPASARTLPCLLLPFPPISSFCLSLISFPYAEFLGLFFHSRPLRAPFRPPPFSALPSSHRIFMNRSILTRGTLRGLLGAPQTTAIAETFVFSKN